MWWTTLLTLFTIWKFAVSEDVLCALPPKALKEIQSYEPLIKKIIQETTKGSYKGQMYKTLAEFTDTYGNRLLGSKNLELSIDHLKAMSTKPQLKTTTETVKVPVWTRGKETAYIVTESGKRKLKIKGLGMSPSGKINAPLLVVKNFEELEKEGKKVSGKVVLFNAEFTEYAKTSLYRIEGPAKASKLGAVGALVRSITPFSIGSRHTGVTFFDKNVKPIPAASVSLEDADKLDRLFRRNKTVTIIMNITNELQAKEAVSRNLINDFTGTIEPKKHVIVSGHIDSWDVGEGALDNGGGAFLAMHTLLLLNALKVPPPRRTLRTILWTGEEFGLLGAKAYFNAHKNEMNHLIMAFESSAGLYKPLGFKIKGNNNMKCMLSEILKLYKEIKADKVKEAPKVGSDISVFQDKAYSLVEPLFEKNNYYWFYHSDGDSMRVMNSTYMDENLALMAGTAYIMANITLPMPKLDDGLEEVSSNDDAESNA